MQWSWDSQKFYQWLKSSYVFIILGLVYIPLITVIIFSFAGASSRDNIILNLNNPTVANYLTLWTQNEFQEGIINSLLLMLFVVPVSVLIALFTSFGIWKSKKWQKPVQGLSNINIAIPDIITGISLFLLFSSFWIPLGFNLGYWTVAISHVSFATPYAIFTIYPRMQSLQPNLLYASSDLGAKWVRTFNNVIVPHVFPSIIAAIVIAVGLSFDDFVITLLTSGNFRTLSTNIYLSARGIKAWIVTFSALLIVVLTVAALLISYWKKQKEKHHKNGQ